MKFIFRKLLKIFLVLFSIFLFIVFILDTFVMPSVVKQDETMIVPNVIGLKVSDAIRILSDSHFVPIQSEIRIDKNKAVGSIVSQNPMPNRKVKTNRRVYLTISGGEEFFLMPNIVGKSFREVNSIFAYHGITLGNLIHDTSLTYPKGTVKFQSIQPKTKIKNNQIVDVILSFGESQTEIKIPNLIGKNLKVVEKLIINSGLLVGNISYSQKRNSKINIVLMHEPAADQIVSLNKKIDLVVSNNE